MGGRTRRDRRPRPLAGAALAALVSVAPACAEGVTQALVCRDADGGSVAVEVKRRGEIDGVEQLTRYLELLNRDPLLAPVKGVFAAQEIKPQARVLAADRGIGCLVLDYDAMRGVDDVDARLF